MTTLIVRQVVRVLVVCVGVSLVTFSILHVSGDPVALIMPEALQLGRPRDNAPPTPCSAPRPSIA